MTTAVESEPRTSFFGTSSRRPRDDYAEAGNEALAIERKRLERGTLSEDTLVSQLQIRGMLGEGSTQIRLRLLLENRKRAHPSQGGSRVDEENPEVLERERSIRRVSLQVQQRVLERRYPNTLRKLDRLRRCIVCNELFRRCSSLGKWECMYHPGRVEGRTCTWTCCGRSSAVPGKKALDGCTRCDHRDRDRRRDGILAYRIDDAELSALIEPEPRAVRPFIELASKDQEHAVSGRWSSGYFQSLVSKRDMNPRKHGEGGASSVQITDDMREQDAMMVPYATAQPHQYYIPTRFSLQSPDEDPTRRRGEQMTASEEFATKSAARLLLNKNQAPPIPPQANYRQQLLLQGKRSYYIVTAAFEPDPVLNRRLIQ